jgi:hypothetical protein
MNPVEIETRTTIAAPRDAVWRALIFYEQIEERPPLLLRLLLPIPLGAEGSKSAVGDEARCIYEGHGQLLKRVTRIDAGHFYGFEVAEQQIAIGGGLRLHGGSYALRELAPGRTELAITTRYSRRGRLAALLRPAEALVCHLFHRHLLAAIARKAEGR